MTHKKEIDAQVQDVLKSKLNEPLVSTYNVLC